MKFVLVTCLFLSQGLFAASWQSNIDHSEILFKIPYMKVSEVSGRFKDFKASAELNNDSLDSVTIAIDSSSVDTGHKMRDNHLKGHDFFKSKDFEKINFTSSKISKVAPGKFKIEGKLSIKDITRPAVFEAELSGNMKDTWGYDNRFAKFSGKINRRDFDMNWNKTLDQQEFLVGEVINISGVFQLQPASAITPNSKHMIPDTETIREKDFNRQAPKEESGFVKKVRDLINGK